MSIRRLDSKLNLHTVFNFIILIKFGNITSIIFEATPEARRKNLREAETAAWRRYMKKWDGNAYLFEINAQTLSFSKRRSSSISKRITLSNFPVSKNKRKRQ